MRMPKVWRKRNWAAPVYLEGGLDAVVLTHAHLDHSGYLPRLLAEDSRVAGMRVGDLDMPEGSLLISILREGEGGFVPTPDTILEAGDEVLAVLDPGLEEELKVFFGSDGASAD